MALALSFRVDSTTLAFIGGSLAVAIGLSLQNVISSFIAGITIIFDRPFQVGDRVSFAGQYGDIIKIGLRSTRMNTLVHNIITISNNKVLTDVPSSGNWGALEMQTAFDIYIGVDQDAELASELIREVCLTSPYVFLDRSRAGQAGDHAGLRRDAPEVPALRLRLQIREAVRDGRSPPRRESLSRTRDPAARRAPSPTRSVVALKGFGTRNVKAALLLYALFISPASAG